MESGSFVLVFPDSQLCKNFSFIVCDLGRHFFDSIDHRWLARSQKRIDLQFIAKFCRQCGQVLSPELFAMADVIFEDEVVRLNGIGKFQIAQCVFMSTANTC